MRATVSEPPGGNSTTIRTGRTGYSAASAVNVPAAKHSATHSSRMNFARRLLEADAGIANHPRPLRVIALHESGKFLRRSARREICTELRKAAAQVRSPHNLRNLGVHARDDLSRRRRGR